MPCIRSAAVVHVEKKMIQARFRTTPNWQVLLKKKTKLASQDLPVDA
jgi:hypothetical protein